jgi:hypothetical protein
MKKLFQSIAKFNQAVEKFFFGNVSEETKTRVVASIKKANSREYQTQQAHHAIMSQVLDDVLSDPTWYAVAVDALEYRKSQGK